MKTNKVRVGVNGYGVIGKRVADAVRLQPDMELVGVSDIISDYRIKVAVGLDLPLYASLPEKESDQVDNQSIAIPENIDAIRALSGIVSDGQESIRMTNDALGIKRNFIGNEEKGR